MLTPDELAEMLSPALFSPALTRYLIVVQGATTMSSWSMPIMLAPLDDNTPMTRKVTFEMRISLPTGDSPSKSSRFNVVPIMQTLLALSTSRSVKMSPSSMSCQSRTSRYVVVVPTTDRVFQLLRP